MATFENTVFENVEERAVAWLEDPNPGWANPTDCGEWPCTAPRNVVLKFENSQFLGTITPVRVSKDFTLVYDLKSATEAYAGCESVSYWNMAYCRNDKLGVLLFESLDDDKRDRTV